MDPKKNPYSPVVIPDEWKGKVRDFGIQIKQLIMDIYVRIGKCVTFVKPAEGKGLTSEQKEQAQENIGIIVVNALDTTDAGYVLDARAGKTLNDKFSSYIPKTSIVNSLNESAPGKVLDASQGYWLNEKFDDYVPNSSVTTALNVTAAGKVLDARAGKTLNDRFSNFYPRGDTPWDDIEDLATWLTTKSVGDMILTRITGSALSAIFQSTTTVTALVQIMKASANNAYYQAFNRDYAANGNIDLNNFTVNVVNEFATKTVVDGKLDYVQLTSVSSNSNRAYTVGNNAKAVVVAVGASTSKNIWIVNANATGGVSVMAFAASGSSVLSITTATNKITIGNTGNNGAQVYALILSGSISDS